VRRRHLRRRARQHQRVLAQSRHTLIKLIPCAGGDRLRERGVARLAGQTLAVVDDSVVAVVRC
jgi:hypothetical protein